MQGHEEGSKISRLDNERNINNKISLDIHLFISSV